MKYKWLIPAVLALSAGALVWYNLSQMSSQTAQSNTGPKNGPLVKVVKVAPRDLTQRVMAPGNLEASGVQEVRAPFTTTRVKLMVEAGEQVKEGQVLALLEDSDLVVTVANQEAGVARAQATLAGYLQQRQTSRAQLAQKLESAKAQLASAELALQNALKQPASARQRVEQAQVSLLTIQNRAAAPSADLTAARQKLQAADAQHRANPLDPAARKALDEAQAAYIDAVRRSTDSARQTVAELAQAQEALRTADRELADAEAVDSAAARQARLQVESARLAVELAQQDLAAAGPSPEQVRSAEADLAAQQTALANSRQKLAQASLRAPAAGTVLTVVLKSGQPATQNQLLFELGGVDRLMLKVKVDELDVGKLRVGQPLTVRNNAFPGDLFNGKVTKVAVQSSAPDARQAASGAAGAYYEVQGEVENAAGKLRSGMTAEARIMTDTRKGVLVVGLESVREEGDKAQVLVVKDFNVELRDVKLGLRTLTQVEVVDGLKAGEDVVVGPFNLIKTLKPGTGVRVEVTQPLSRGDDE